MDNSEFPPNSEVSKRRETEDRNIQRVTSGDAIRKKKSLRKQFKETFVAGDVKSAIRYGLFDVALPSARDMVLETLIGSLEKWFRGDTYRRVGGSTPPPSGPYGNVNYTNYSRIGSRMSSPQRAMSRAARARHDFDEIVLESRTEAEEVIERLFDLVDRYGTATVADLYDLVGLTASHPDNRWGWTDLRGAGVSRTRDGYLLDLPDPHPVN